MAERDHKKFPINEHFYTWQGEGVHMGKPAYFIRLHGCPLHCVAQGTQVLMADGTHKTIENIRVGDEVISYDDKSLKTRIVPNKVLAQWPTGEKRTLIITLEDGTRLQVTDDHRVLAGEYIPNKQGIRKIQRRYFEEPYSGYVRADWLKVGHYLRGGGLSWFSPEKTDNWYAGYLAGIMDGDGHIGDGWISFACLQEDNDLTQFVVSVSEYFATPLHYIKPQTTDYGTVLDRLRLPEKYRQAFIDTISWRDNSEFARGYLAGMFDTDGTTGRKNQQQEDATASALYVVQSDNSSKKQDKLRRAFELCELTYKELNIPNKSNKKTPGAAENSKRFYCTSMTVTQLAQFLDLQCGRKRRNALYTGIENLWKKVVSIEEGDIVPTYDITTESGNFFAENIQVHNCSFCDSAGTWHSKWVPDHVPQYTALELGNLIAPVLKERHNAMIVITGGEPGIYNLAELVSGLLSTNGGDRYIAVETSGAFDLKDNLLINHVCVSPKKAKMPTASSWRRADELKFIIEHPDDIKLWTDEALRHRLKSRGLGLQAVWLHPEWSQRENPDVLAAITEAVKYDQHRLPYRAGWQLHKLYAADKFDPNSDKRLIPLGGDPKKGY